MAEKWNADCGGDTQSTPVIGTDAVYVCSNSGKLYAFDKNTGKQNGQQIMERVVHQFQR